MTPIEAIKTLRNMLIVNYREDDAVTLAEDALNLYWRPIYPDEHFPPVDADGYSDMVLVSFDNADSLDIGQYRVDKRGGTFYSGDTDDKYLDFDLHVNAWMPLPKRYEDK